jgi:hypothetical protein
MELWQLVSIMRDSTALLQSIASSQENWKQFVIWFEDFGKLVHAQDRSKRELLGFSRHFSAHKVYKRSLNNVRVYPT